MGIKHKELAEKAKHAAGLAGSNANLIPAAVQAYIELLEAHIKDMDDLADQVRAQDTIERLKRGERAYNECPIWKRRHKVSAAA